MSTCYQILILQFMISVSLSFASDTITTTTPLYNNQTLVSSGGNFALGFFSPPNSNSRYLGIWYATIPIQTVVWVANRAAPADSTAILSISPSGSLSVISGIGNGNATKNLWSTPSMISLSNPAAKLLDNGNLVVKDADAGDDGPFVWQSFDHPTDTLVADMKLGVDFRTGTARNLTSWKSAADPSPGEYTLAFDVRGSPEMFLYSGGAAADQKLWRTGPWTGLQFSGIPETTSYENFTFGFVNSGAEISYSFDTDSSIVSRLVVNGTGVVQRSVWIPGGGDTPGEWNFFWYAPKDQCDDMGECGPYGACDPNGSPICSCLQGFDPRFPANWALRDGSGGCVRRTGLDCRNGTDGFVKVAGAKLPDTTNCTVDRSASGLDECRSECMKNCSCVAYAVANVSGGGSGCIFWYSELLDIRIYTDDGQDLYVRLAAADVGSTSQSHKSRHTTIAIMASLVLGALLLTTIGYYLLKKKRRRDLLGMTPSINHYNNESSRGNDLELPLFDMDTIVTATNNFSLGNKLGEGGFGPVYKGNLGDLQEIAVKRLAKTSVQGLDEFRNEVMLIAKLQHRNLVRLLGYCIQGSERMLVYEYMHNKSLDSILFDKARATLLDWQTRYNIIIGIARGLLYLHQDSRFRIIHRDLKASNILLDKEMNPKISDFGMARIFGGEEVEASTRRVVGTYGYMSPEYAMDGIFSVKSDVFSFGVLVLEIISGKKNRGVYYASTHVNLLGHAWSLWNEGNSVELVDKSMGHNYNLDEVLKCIKTGLLCVQQRPEDRPLMSSVILMLGNDDTSLPFPKQPGFVAKQAHFETDSSSSKQESCTLNDMTFTTVEGR